MSTNTVERSPLRAARAWRRISLAAAARAAGIPLTQAEALESGDATAFPTTDEMIASAVLYGATLGVGRDEALALLDRTIAGANDAEGRMFADVTADAPVARPLADFSHAVDAARDAQAPEPVAAAAIPTEVAVVPLPAPVATAPVVADEVETPDDVEATGEIERIDIADARTNEVADVAASGVWSGADAEAPIVESLGSVAAPLSGAPVTSWVRDRASAMFGDQRASSISRRFERADEGVRDSLAAVRTRLRQSEHGTLILAICVGVVLIALLVAISAAVGSGSKQAPLPKAVSATSVVPGAVHSTSPSALVAAKDITVDVDNAGSISGKAGHIAYKVKGLGYTIGQIGNISSTRYASSIILYSTGMQREAVRLSKQIGISTMDVLPGKSTDPYIRVVVL